MYQIRPGPRRSKAAVLAFVSGNRFSSPLDVALFIESRRDLPLAPGRPPMSPNASRFSLQALAIATLASTLPAPGRAAPGWTYQVIDEGYDYWLEAERARRQTPSW